MTSQSERWDRTFAAMVGGICWGSAIDGNIGAVIGGLFGILCGLLSR